MGGAGGITTEENYPYDDATPACTAILCNSQDEDTLKANLASYGPVSIACDASEWSSYTGGILTSSSCKSSSLKLDHAIQLVGYNEDGVVGRGRLHLPQDGREHVRHRRQGRDGHALS